MKNKNIDTLITDNLDLWTSAIENRSASGRGSSKKINLYGIKKLRELILELAVRGKLVPQDPNDEPASVLLERIAKEKEKLIKEGKIKKQKKLPEIGEDEMPFELPEGWDFVRLGDITDRIGSGSTPRGGKSAYTEKGIPFLRSQNVFNDGLRLKDVALIPIETHKKMSNTIVKAMDILLNITGASLGRCALIPDDFNEANVSQHVSIIRPTEKLTRGYLHICIISPYVQGMIWGRQVGMAREGLSKKVLELFEIPIPPLPEQYRIVSKVDSLMSLCDQLEQQTENSLTAHQTLVETLLDTLTQSQDAEELAQNWNRISDHFDTLFTTEQSIDSLKQTILQLAVMGKLVEQDPDDEPASVLLEKIAKERDNWLATYMDKNPECKTMHKKLKKLEDADAPFQLPYSWEPVHLIQISQLLVDCHNKTAPYVDSGIPIIRTSNIRDRNFRLSDLKYVNEKTYQYWSRRCPPEPGDIMFTREAPMGEAAIVPNGVKWCLGQRTMLIRPMHKFISNDYLLLTLTEPHLLQRASKHAVGLTVKHLRVGDVEKLNLPLPPLAEQHRIVSKVDELMKLCDQLKEKLSNIKDVQLSLADSVVEKVLI